MKAKPHLPHDLIPASLPLPMKQRRQSPLVPLFFLPPSPSSSTSLFLRHPHAMPTLLISPPKHFTSPYPNYPTPILSSGGSNVFPFLGILKVAPHTRYCMVLGLTLMEPSAPGGVILFFEGPAAESVSGVIVEGYY